MKSVTYLKLSGNYLDCRKYTEKNGWPAIFEESCNQDDQLYEIPKPDRRWVKIVIFVVLGVVGVAVVVVVAVVAVFQVKKCIKNRPAKDKAKKPLISKQQQQKEATKKKSEVELDKAEKKDEDKDKEKPKKKRGPAKLLNMYNAYRGKSIETIQAGEPIGRALCRRAPPRMDCESTTDTDVSLCVLAGFTGLYDTVYQRARIHDAGIEAGLRTDQAVRVSTTCADHAQKYVSEHQLPAYLSAEDIEGIALYTFEFDAKNSEQNPERLINSALYTKKFDRIAKVKSLMYIVLSSLRKLPVLKGPMLFRGVRGPAKLDVSQYYEGNTVAWPEITSTTKSIEVVKAFLTETYNSSSSSSRWRSATSTKSMCPVPRGTIFVIDGGWGYDIQEYSLNPEYEEVVLEPDRQFVVKSVIPGEVAMIYLEMVNTPVPLESKMPLTFSDEVSGVTIVINDQKAMSSKKNERPSLSHHSQSPEDKKKKKKKKSKKKSSGNDVINVSDSDNDDGNNNNKKKKKKKKGKKGRGRDYVDYNDDDDDDSGDEKSGLVKSSTPSKKHSSLRHDKKLSNDDEDEDEEAKKSSESGDKKKKKRFRDRFKSSKKK